MNVLFEDEVQVTFQAVNPVPGFIEPKREILLSAANPEVVFGRCSSKHHDLEPAADNGYISSPIMSREHATVFLDPETKTILIEDHGSTHGTYYNGSAVAMHGAQELAKDDMVAFGITITRDGQEFPRCIMKVTEIIRGEKRRDDTVKTFGLIDIESSDEELDLDEIEDEFDDRDEIQETTMLEVNDIAVPFSQDNIIPIDPDVAPKDASLDVVHSDSDLRDEPMVQDTTVTIDLVEIDDTPTDAQAVTDSTPPTAVEETLRATSDIREISPAEPPATRKIAPLPSRFTDKVEKVKQSVETQVAEVILDSQAVKRTHHDVGGEADTDDRTYKRIRKAAEVFGYMTLGGVATVAALIASAPAL